MAACGNPERWVVFGSIPPEAQTVLVGIEQGELRVLQAQPVAEGVMELEVPDAFSGDEPILLTRLAVRESLTELGLPRPGPLPSSPPRSRPISSLEILAAQSVGIDGSDSASLVDAAISPWIMEHPVPRSDACLRGATEELIRVSSGPRDILELWPGFAIAVFVHDVVFLDTTGPMHTFPFLSGELAGAAGLGAGGRVWVATSSRAFVVDPNSGVFSASVPIPSEVSPIGVAEDPSTNDLYLFSTRAQLWRRRVGQPAFELFYSVPVDRVRRPGIENQTARFHFTGPGQFIMAVDDLSAVIEVAQEEVRLLSNIPVGSGFRFITRTQTGRVLLAEAARGDLFEYFPGRLEPRGQLPTRLMGLVPLDEDGRRLAFLGSAGALGTIDLELPEDCSAIQAGQLTGPDAFIGVGSRFLVRGEIHRSTYGIAWLELEF